MTDPTPHHRRSPMEHERDAAPDTSAEPTRYMVPGGHGIESFPAGLLYRRDDVVPVLAENAALRAEVERLREALRGHQIWESAEKVEPDEFVLWTPDGQVCLRLKVTHHHDRLDPAGVEFVTCDLLDLLNALAALAQKDHER